jgi:hypothetical protein
VVGVSLAADRRGRVPFALVGVLLLVGATTYATGLASHAPATVERPATEAMDGATRDARPALRSAVQQAVSVAARQPVTRPADTPVGAVLNDSQPFLDSVRIRIAVAARVELSTVERRRDGVTATVSLPPIDDVADLRTAKRAVRLTRLDGNRSVQVTVQNVTVRATRDGETVSERTVDVTLVVSTPAFALHDRVERYQARLDRGPLEGPGLGRGLTARLYPVTWARGYARYGGAPIQNVLANRHVELSTNGALLGQQRAVFGRDDPDGARAVQVATARVGVTDVLGPSPKTERVTRLLEPNAVDDGNEFRPESPDVPPVNASAEAAADQAYLAVTEDLTSRLSKSYRLRTTLTSTVSQTHDGVAPSPNPPGANWSLAATTPDQELSVTDGRTGVAEPPSGATVTPSEATYVRQVVVTHAATRYWVGPDGAERQTVEWTDRYRVEIATRAAYAPLDTAPSRPTRPLFRRGGVCDGPNLGVTAEESRQALLVEHGGPDTIARTSVQRAVLDRTVTESGDPSSETAAWVRRDLWRLRSRVANLTVAVPQRAMASGDANPAKRLASELRARRARLVDAPARYDGVADRARVGTRAAYVDAVIHRLDERAESTEARTDDYLTAVEDRTSVELSRLLAVGAGRENRFRRRGTPVGDSIVTVPDGSPAYLTLSAVSHAHASSVARGESVHPLVARNVNWFTVPYGDAADGVAGALFGDEPSVSLATASQALVAANRTGDAGESVRLTDARRSLAPRVGRTVRFVERRSCRRLRSEATVARETCLAAVQAASQHWTGTGRRGLAIANGSYARAIGDELERGGVDAGTANRAEVHLRVLHRNLATEERTAIDAGLTNETVGATRSLARAATTELLTKGLENATRRTATRLTGGSRLPAGLPVAPVPGYWYATVNGWSVTVRGEYQRFAVRSYVGGPDGTGGAVSYVRDGEMVRLDVDGDGHAERLGRSERVAFETETVVVAAVPPGPVGVGDVDGNRDERSPGWPCPGRPGTDERCTQKSG